MPESMQLPLQGHPVSTLDRPERSAEWPKPLDFWWHGLRRHWPDRRRSLRYFQRLATRVLARAEHWQNLSEPALAEQLAQLKIQIRSTGYTEPTMVEAVACARELCGRTLAKRHFPTQIAGGLALLHGCLAEMQTGEGKSLTALIPAALAGWAGSPVHLVTVNDYLASRDAEEMRPFFTAAGLSVGQVVAGMEKPARREAYHCDVVYCSNKELAFDYLKDQLLLEGVEGRLQRFAQQLTHKHSDLDTRLMQRGLHFAIVDEADSVLLDEGRTPLIISGETSQPADVEACWRQAVSVVPLLQAERDFRLHLAEKRVELLDTGLRIADRLVSDASAPWLNTDHCCATLEQGLRAWHLLRRDHDYLIDEQKVVIIDQNTGRPMPDRSWEAGLHQLVELKENCPLSKPRKTLTRMTLQQFFRQYFHLAGLSGTASEARAELWQFYSLPIVTIPTWKPGRRRYTGMQLLPDQAQKWHRIAVRAAEVASLGRAVLIGTESVADSDKVSAELTALGTDHRLLNARQDASEADIIAVAGQPGCITVATNMAGRGTDIKLAEAVADAGGLHVILANLNEFARVDRQLLGRAARMGDPGSYEYVLAGDDSFWPGRLARHLYALSPALLLRFARWWQARQERRACTARLALQKRDKQRASDLAFAGRG